MNQSQAESYLSFYKTGNSFTSDFTVFSLNRKPVISEKAHRKKKIDIRFRSCSMAGGSNFSKIFFI